MKLLLVDEDSTIELSSEDSFDLDVMNKVRFRFQQKCQEIGWAEIEQHLNGALEVEFTIVGTFAVYDGATPDLTLIKGNIPASLRKD